MRFRTVLIAAAAASSALATPAMAHRQWLLPSTTTLAGTSEYVTVDAAVSNDLFYPDHVAPDPAAVKVWAPDGSEGKVENPSKGRYRGTFDVAIDKPGTWKIGMERSMIGGTFKLNGEQWRVGGRRPPMAPGAARPSGAAPAGAAPAGAAPARAPGAPGSAGGQAGGQPMRMVASVAEIPAGATEVKLTESLSTYAIYVSADAPTKGVLTPTGKGLEFDPVTHPDALVSDEEAQFRFLVDGKPAAGVKVTLVPGGKKYREAEHAQELTTGADGMVRVKWPVAGMYWMSATTEDAKPSDKRASARRMTFGSTLEVVAP